MHNKIYIDIQTAAVPLEGYCFVDRYWVCHPVLGLLFIEYGKGFRTGAPQCNSNQAIARQLQEKLYPKHSIKFMSVVFVGHRDV